MIEIKTSNIFPLVKGIQEKAEINMEKRRCEVYEHLNERISAELTEEEINRLSEPKNAVTFNATINRLVCSDTIEKRRMLEDILIQKAKFDGSTEKGLDYDKAINIAYELTPNEIRLLVFIEVYSTILCSIINGTGSIENVKILSSYLENSHFNIQEVKKCENSFMLYEKAQYEHDLSALDKFQTKDDDLQYLILQVKDILDQHYDIDLNSSKKINLNIDTIKLASYRLTNPGRLIARCQLSEKDVNYVANDIFPLKLSDFIANNVFGIGNVAAGAAGIKEED